MTERTEKGQFAKGHSGNINGKPAGTRNKTTLAALSLLDGETEALTRKAIDLALDGDTTALRLCLERITPPAKERPIENFNLPPINNSQGVLDALDAVAQQLASGDLLPSEAKAICYILDKYQHHFEINVLAQRLEALETILKARQQ